MRKLTTNQTIVLEAVHMFGQDIDAIISATGLKKQQIKSCIGSLWANGYSLDKVEVQIVEEVQEEEVCPFAPALPAESEDTAEEVEDEDSVLHEYDGMTEDEVYHAAVGTSTTNTTETTNPFSDTTNTVQQEVDILNMSVEDLMAMYSVTNY